MEQGLQYTVLALAGVIPLLIWMYVSFWKNAFQYWQRKGVPHLEGKFPFGSDRDYTKPTSFPGSLMQKMYDRFLDCQYFGIYEKSVPHLVLRDLEAVRLVMAKEFSHFRDRNSMKPRPDDILANHLFLLEGVKWRSLRVKMTPVFTSGKLKAMFPLFLKCAETLDKVLLTKLDEPFDVKDITSRYSSDVICSCAFGLEVDFLGNSDSSTYFRKILSNRSFEGSVNRIQKLIIKLSKIQISYFPFLKRKYYSRIVSKELENYMLKTISDTVEYREKTGEKRNDFIDLLMSLREKGALNEQVENDYDKDVNLEPVIMNLEVMTAQCYVFFAAGFETSSSVKSFCLYELAYHQDIQDKLREEINESIEKNKGITYQGVQDMEYLDMVVSETMRKYPTLYKLNRICTKPYIFPSGHKIDKGQQIIIPVWAIHHDSNLYPDPEKFVPERFSKENKESRHPFAYLPFGEGPRVCIGMRFGLLQTKMGLITVLRTFKVEPSDKTVYPIKLKDDHIPTTRPTEPIMLKLTKWIPDK